MECFNTKKNNIIKGYIRYNFTKQKEIVPNLITLAAVMDAVLLQDDFPYGKTKNQKSEP